LQATISSFSATYQCVYCSKKDVVQNQSGG
jgi:hypothetical protein